MKKNMPFEAALEELKNGEAVGRKGWNGKDMWLKIQLPDKNSKMTLPYIYMFTAQGDLIPWLASQADILAEDWQTVIPPLVGYVLSKQPFLGV